MNKIRTGGLQKELQKTAALPYIERVQPMSEIYQYLLSLGHDERTAERILRSCGVSRCLLFRVNKHLLAH